MVMRKDRGRFSCWLEAEREVSLTDICKGEGHPEGCCFLAQQAGIYRAHPFSGKGLLDNTWGASVQVFFVEVSLPCTRVSSSVWAPTHSWTAPEQVSKVCWLS